MFTKTSSELAPEEDPARCSSLVDGAALCDVGLHQPLCRPDDRTSTKDICRNCRANFSVVGFGGETNSAFVGLGVQGLGRARALAEGAPGRTSRARIAKVAGVQAFVFAPPSLPGAGGGLPISVVIQSTGEPSQVFEVAEEIKNKAQASGRFIVVQNSLAFDAPQVTVTIDRDRAAALDLPIARHRQDAGACWSAAARSRSSTAIPTATTSSCRCRRSTATTRNGSAEFYRAQRQRRDGAAVGGGDDLDQRLAGLDRAVQPAELRDDFGPAAAGRHHRRRAAGHRKHRQTAAARRLLHRLFRPVAAGEGAGQHDPDRLRAGRRRDLSGAGGAVRELPRSADHHDVGAAVDLRRHRAAQPRPRHAQHLHPGRPDHADRPDHQARHPAGRVRQPAARTARHVAVATRSSPRRRCGCGRS